MKEAHRSEMILSDENLVWTEQHHRNTSHKSMHNLSSGHLSSSVFDLGPSGDESDSAEKQRRSHFYAPDPHKRTKEYHIEQATQAIQVLKAASKPTGWKKVLKHKSGCLVSQSTNNGDKHPAFKGEHVLRGYRAQDVFSVVGVRKLWDDWYDELSCVESYDDATNLMYMVMKGTLSSKTRDISMVERIEVEKDGTIYFASCSVESSKIPLISGKVRADIFVAGWIIQPLPSNPPITKITYVIQTDLLSRLPKFIARRALAKRPLVITTIETHLKKNGVPMVMSNLVSQTANRHRSLSEPLKPEKFAFSSPDSDEPVQSGSAFLSPIKGPIQPDVMEQLDDKDDSGDDDLQLAMASVNDGSTIRNSQTSLAPSLMSHRSLAPSIFTPEFLESNALLGDTALFGDSLLFGKGGIYESTMRKDQQASEPKAQQQAAQTRIHDRTRPSPPQAARTVPTESEARSRQSSYRTSQVQPAPIPVKAEPKSSRQSARATQPSTPERTVIAPTVTLATPPLTPTTSIDGKDTASDSDASLTPKVKVVPRVPKVHAHVDTSLPSRPSSMAFAAFGMQSPSAIMEARRHSTLIGRSSSFAPRHSQAVPLRGTANATLQGLGRASLTMAPLTNAAKRSSTVPSLDSSRSSTLLSSSVPLPHRHSETARKALAMFKVLASSPEDRWRAVSTEGTFKCYSRIISGAGLPMLRGEGVITGGWSVEQINAVIESSGCRQIWDERFENLSIAETFNSNEYLFHVTLRGIGSLTGRDLAGVTIIDRDPQTSTLCNVATSVLDSTIPEDPGRIRAMLELSGWSLRPTFDNQGNTISVSVTFVIQVDIRGTLPTSVVKSTTGSMMTAVSRLNQFINKTGYPPYASHISGTRLLDTFEPKTGFYELCYKAAPGWTEVRVGRKVYKDGYDFFIKPDDPTVRVELAPDFGGVRIWTTLDHEGQSIVAQVTRKGQNPVEGKLQSQQQSSRDDDSERENQSPSPSPSRRDSSVPRRQRDSSRGDGSQPAYGGPSLRKSSSHLKSNDDHLVSDDGSATTEAGGGSDLRPHEAPSSIGRKRRSASYTTLSAFDPNLNASSSPLPPPPPPSVSDRPVSAADRSSQALMVLKDSPESERSRSRSRVPRSLITSVTSGAPAPPLPRRSSSLSRYSIPIMPYLSPSDAPPLPSLPLLTSPTDSRSSFEHGSRPTIDTTPKFSPVITFHTTSESTESTESSTSPPGSPTLGPFHIPHQPVASIPEQALEKNDAVLVLEQPKDIPCRTSSMIATTRTITATTTPTTTTPPQIKTVPSFSPSILQPAAEIPSCEPVPGSTKKSSSISNLIASMAVIRDMEAAVKKEQEEEQRALEEAEVPLTPLTSSSVSSLADMSSPVSSPVPKQHRVSGMSPRTTLDQVLTSALSTKSSLSALTELAADAAAPVAAPRRVTFSPEVVDNSDKPPMSKKPKKQSKKALVAAAAVAAAAANAAIAAEIAAEASAEEARAVERELNVQESNVEDKVSASVACPVVVETVEADGYESDEAEFVEALTELVEEQSEELKEDMPEITAVLEPESPVEVRIKTIKKEEEEGEEEELLMMEIDHEQDHEAVWSGAVGGFESEMNSRLLQATLLILVLVCYANGLGGLLLTSFV